MHDREDPRTREVLGFGRTVSGEKAPHPGRTAGEGRRHARGEHGVERSAFEHRGHRLVLWYGLDMDVRRQRERLLCAPAGLLEPADVPAALAGPHVVLLLEYPAEPHVRRELVLAAADALAAQIGGRGDPG